MKHLRYLLIIFSLMLGWASAGMAQDFDKGLEAIRAEDYKTALREYGPLARQGYPQAQFVLGWMYSGGKGVLQNYAEALKWYRLAAGKGHPLAQYSVGLMYEKGEGVPEDNAEAVKWYHLAAKQGTVKAQESLALMYLLGKGVRLSPVMAHMWANIAAANGNDGELRDTIELLMEKSEVSKAQAMARECMGSGYKNCGW